MDKCRNLGDSRKEGVKLKYVMFTDVYGISGIIHHFALLPDHRWLKPCGCRPVGRPNSILVPCEKFSFLGNAFCIRNVYCESCSSPTDNRVNNRPHPRALPPPSRLPARTWPAPSQCRSHRDRNGQLVSSTKKKGNRCFKLALQYCASLQSTDHYTDSFSRRSTFYFRDVFVA